MSVSILSKILTSKCINGGMIPSILSKPSTNKARVVNPRIMLMTVASRLCFAIDSSSIFLASSTALLIAAAVKEAVDEAVKIDESSMAKHNRDATVISMVLGFTTLALFVDGLLRMLGIVPPFMDLDVNILERIVDRVETDVIDKVRQVPIQKLFR